MTEIHTDISQQGPQTLPTFFLTPLLITRGPLAAPSQPPSAFLVTLQDICCQVAAWSSDTLKGGPVTSRIQLPFEFAYMVLEQPWRWAEGNHLSGGVHFPHSLWSPLSTPLGPFSILDCPTKMPERAPCSQLPSHQNSLERRSPLPHAHPEKTGTPMGSHQGFLMPFLGCTLSL